jgi:undecaprenyl-diphosphatase
MPPQAPLIERLRERWLSRDGLGYLLLFLLIAAAFWGFIEIAGEVIEGDSKSLDRTMLLSLRDAGDINDPLGPVWLEQAVRDLTALGGTLVLTLITAGAVGFLLLERKPRTAGSLLLAIIGGVILSLSLKAGFDRPRPDFLPHGDDVYTASFPSGHSMNAAIVYLLIGAILARAHRRRAVKVYLLAWAIGITVLVGISRVYLGVHWPTDIAAGWTAGAAWTLLCWLLVYHMQRRRLVEREAEMVPDQAEQDGLEPP